jgi:hypothetical protein
MSIRTHHVPEEVQERTEGVGLGWAATEELCLGGDVEMRILVWPRPRD